MKRALVLFSGGQDSTTCLAWALSRYDYVETIGFDYAQRHRVELACRLPVIDNIRNRFPQWAEKVGPDRVIALDFKPLTRSSLLDSEELERSDGLPATFVPGRNLMFLLNAAIVAEQRGIKNLVIGTCETDFSGYPDCRNNTMNAMQVALNLGLHARLTIETPLMWIDKAETWALAQELGGSQLVEIIRNDTHTCYHGDRSHFYSSGFGCGKCDACKLRGRGYQAWREGNYEL
jgi:7-cyano-7-deazaguanine synthase